MYYNKSIFAKLHLKVPTTWAQFLAVCAKIKASGETPITIGGSQDTWGSWIFLGGMFSTDVLGKNPNWILQRKQNKVHFTDPLVAKVFNAWAGLAKAGYFNKDALSINYASMQQEFLDGKEAMYPMGTWAASATAVGAGKFGVGVFRLPPVQRSAGPGRLHERRRRRQREIGPSRRREEAGGVLVARPADKRDTRKERRRPDRHEGLQAAERPPEGLLQDGSALPTEQHEAASAEERRRDVLQQRRPRVGAGNGHLLRPAAQNIILGHSVKSQLKFLDTQWNKAAKGG